MPLRQFPCKISCDPDYSISSYKWDSLFQSLSSSLSYLLQLYSYHMAPSKPPNPFYKCWDHGTYRHSLKTLATFLRDVPCRSGPYFQPNRMAGKLHNHPTCHFYVSCRLRKHAFALFYSWIFIHSNQSLSQQIVPHSDQCLVFIWQHRHGLTYFSSSADTIDRNSKHFMDTQSAYHLDFRNQTVL